MILDKIEHAIGAYRHWYANRAAGPYGDFHRAGGFSLLWSDLPVTADDVAIDAGGHVGDWASQMACRYGCKLLIFEPVGEYCTKIRLRFPNNSRVAIFEAGLAGQARRADLVVNGLASSIFSTPSSGKSIAVEMADVQEIFATRGISSVACMKLNIEGGEYELLERMLDQNLAPRVRSFLIQFHSNVPEYELRRERIRQRLSKSHRLVFDYPLVWERWDRASG